MAEMNIEEIKKIIKNELPTILKTDPSFRRYIIQITKLYYPSKKKTEDRIEQLYQQLLRMEERFEKKWEEWNNRWEQTQVEWNKRWEEMNDRWEQTQAEWNRKWEETKTEWNNRWEQTQVEWNKRWEEMNGRWEQTQVEWNRKWEETKTEWNNRWEQTQIEWNKRWEENQLRWEEMNGRWEQTQIEWNKRWEENQLRWEENQKTINEILKRLEKIDRRHLYTIGALGARWGLYSEESFRNGLKAIMEESFGIEVMRYVDYDYEGEVFGRPDQVELDLIIRNGVVIACEIKSSMSKSDMYTLWRKKEFYEKKHQRKVDRVIVISPMVDPHAKPVAEKLGIEIYTHSEEFIENEEKNIQ